MSRYQGWFAFVLALAIAAGMFLVRTPLQLGLDLRGGSQLTVELRPAAIGRRLACLPSLHGTNKQRVGSDRCGQESTDSGHRDEYATTAHNVYHSASSVRITVRAASALTSGTVTAQNAQSLSRRTWDAAHL